MTQQIYIFGRVPLWLCEDITANCYMYCYFRNTSSDDTRRPISERQSADVTF